MGMVHPRSSWPVSQEISWLREQTAALLEGAEWPVACTPSFPLAKWGSGFEDGPADCMAWFVDGSEKLKEDGVQWAAPIICFKDGYLLNESRQEHSAL